MTLLCAAIFVREIEQAARDIAVAAERGAEMVELRIDSLDPRLDEAVALLIESSTVPCIVTCRPTWEGGESTESNAERLDRLNAIAVDSAAYIDIELKTIQAETHFEYVADRNNRAGLIVSSHDFETRPVRLLNLVTELNSSSADVAKIIWTARSVRDNQEAFEILQSRQKPTIALCMGEAGLISRVLAKKFGGFLSFASLDSAGGTAPGQVSLEEMKNLYRWDAINEQTQVFGVIGSPIRHSMSPAMHNAAFESINFNAVYLPLLVNEGYESFKAFMETFIAGDGPLLIDGLSVTIPHKENALRYLREFAGGEVSIDPLAARIGAVNTIDVDRSRGRMKLFGTSTDYSAILDCITLPIGLTREMLSGKRVAVIGAGGTGRTAVAALAQCGAEVSLYNRTKDRAAALAKEFDGQTGSVIAADWSSLRDSRPEIIINTTSLGMSPNTDVSPLDDSPSFLRPEMLVFDTVYNPLETKLLTQARTAGATTVHGLEMFIRQGAAQFELWTKTRAPLDVMRKIVVNKLTVK